MIDRPCRIIDGDELTCQAWRDYVKPFYLGVHSHSKAVRFRGYDVI